VRTTLDMDDDLVRALKPVAAAEGRSLGRLVSDLVRTALRSQVSTADRNGFPVFDVTDGSAIFGPDDVANALDD